MNNYALRLTPSLSATCLTILFIGSVITDAFPDDGRRFQYYSVKEGQVTYSLGGMRTGTRSLAFSDYGSRTRQETHATMTVMGQTQREDTVTYTDADWIYAYDPNAKKATKQRNVLAEDFTKQPNRPNVLKNPEDFVKALGGVKVGTTHKLLGYACEVWDIKPLSTKTCFTKEGAALWTEANVGGLTVKETATDVKIGSIPAGTTSLPPGTAVVEIENPLAQLQQLRAQPGAGSGKKKKGKPLTAEEREEAERMHEVFQGNDAGAIQEQIRKMQERLRTPPQANP